MRNIRLPSNHPDVLARVRNEAKEAAAMEYAAGAVSAAMDALAALDAVNLAGLINAPGGAYRLQRETADQLLRLARRQLCEAVGSRDHPGYDQFLDIIVAHGFDIHND